MIQSVMVLHQRNESLRIHFNLKPVSKCIYYVTEAGNKKYTDQWKIS